MLLYREGRDCLCLAGGAEENVCFLPAGGLGWKYRDGGINGNVYGGRQGQKKLRCRNDALAEQKTLKEQS